MSDTINGLMTFNEFFEVVSKKFTQEEVFQNRMYDFEDVAIEYAYKYQDFEIESEDVEIKLNVKSCYANY